MRTSLFNFFDRFRTGEIGDPKKQPRYSDDIQMVSVVQNLSPSPAFVPGFSVPNPILREYAIFFNLLGAGGFGRVEVIPSTTGNGIWISGILGTLTNIDGRHFTIAAPSGLATRVFPNETNATAFGEGLPATTIIDHGIGLVSPPSTMWRNTTGAQDDTRTSMYDLFAPVYIAAGRVYVFQMTQGGVNGFIGVYWREMP